MPVKCDNLLTQTGAARYLGIAEQTLRRWRLGGIISDVPQDSLYRPKYDINELNRVKALRASQALKVSKKQKPTKWGQPWSREDLDYLVDSYGLLSNRQIARRLGRSEISIKSTARRKLHIHLTNNFYTAIELARQLGFKSPNSIVKHARRGWLKGERKLCGKRWYWCFTESDIEECLRQRPWLANLKSMERSYFRSVVQGEWDKDPWYTLEQAAPLLGVTANSIIRYIRRGWLPVDTQEPSGSLPYIIRRSTIESFLKNDNAAQHRVVSRSIATRNGLKKRGFPIRLETVWQIVCPGCGQDVKIVAPPSMMGVEIKERFISVYVNGTCFHSAEVELTIPS